MLVGLQSTVAFFLAWWLADGALFGEGPRRYARILLVAVILGIGVCALALRRRLAPKDRGQGLQDTALAVVALAAAAWGLVGLVLPNAPADAAAGPCEGVPVDEGQLVQTRAGGVNVRSEPSITADQVGRLGGECSIAVDGFCLGGTPLHDAVSKELVDIRWFRLHRNRGWDAFVSERVSGGADEERFVASATISSFVTDKLVPRLPSSQCKTLVPVPEPGPATLTRGDDALDPDTGVPLATFTVSADNTFEFGVSLVVLGDIRTGNPYRKITTWERPDDVSLMATWRYSATARYLTSPATVVIFGGRCFALGAPMETTPESAAVLAYTLNPDGALVDAPAPPLDRAQVEGLADTACREDLP